MIYAFILLLFRDLNLSLWRLPLLLGTFLITLTLLSGCSDGYRAQMMTPPSPALDCAVYNASQDPLIAYSTPLPSDWWTLFQDDQLNAFITKAFAQNPTLDTARAKIFSARFLADKARSALYPNLSFGADVSRQKLSETGLIPFHQNPQSLASDTTGLPTPGGVNGIPVYFTQYETEFLLTYEFDFWEKNQNTLKAAIGNMQATMADEIFARLQLGITLAKTYFQLQTAYQRREIYQKIVDNRRQYLQLIEKRLVNNIDSDIILDASRTKLFQAKQSLLQIEADIITFEFTLKYYLAGDFDENITPIEITEASMIKVPIPSDLPLNLIAHRPDIISQLWLIESAGKQIEVAKAGFYPNFSLGALFGFQTIHFSKLFRWPSAEYNINPAMNLPIFDGGLLRSNLHTSEVNYDLAIYHYNELIINAVKEVLENLALLRNSNEQRIEFTKQSNQQQNIYELTRLRMLHHLNSQQDTLDAEMNRLIAQDQETVALGNTIQAILTLIKALGGGYETCYEAKNG